MSAHQRKDPIQYAGNKVENLYDEEIIHILIKDVGERELATLSRRVSDWTISNERGSTFVRTQEFTSA